MTPYNVTTQFTRTHGTLLLAVAMDPKEIGRRIAEARNRKGWTQFVFATEANVSISTVQRWEGGKLPAVRELMRIADVLEVEPEQLVEVAPTDEDQVAALRGEVGELRADVATVLKWLRKRSA